MQFISSHIRKTIFVILLIISGLSYGQEQQLAHDYFRKGEYDKAAMVYQKLYDENNFNATYLSRLIYCKQQLEEFEATKKIIENHLVQYPSQIQFKVELGYNYQLQHQQEVANTLYAEALNLVKENPIYGYSIGRTFQKITF